MSNLQRYRHNQLNGGLNGSCGWICKKLGQLRGLVVGIPIIGDVAAGYIDTAVKVLTFAIDVFSKGTPGSNTGSISTGAYEPTKFEQILLDAFSNKFNVFFKNVSLQLSGAFANNDFNAQLTVINEILAKICVIKQYYAINEKEGLSLDAIQARAEFINVSCKLLEDLIANSINKYSSKVILKPCSYTLNNAAAFNGLMKIDTTGQTYSCQRYVDTEIPNSNSAPGQQAPGVLKQPKITLSNVLVASSILLTVYQLTKEEKKQK